MWSETAKKEARDSRARVLILQETSTLANFRDKIEKIDETKPAPPDVLPLTAMTISRIIIGRVSLVVFCMFLPSLWKNGSSEAGRKKRGRTGESQEETEEGGMMDEGGTDRQGMTDSLSSQVDCFAALLKL